MRKGWRWSLTGFAAGGLAATTVLAANVVGAVAVSGPARQSERPHLRDVLHTPPVLLGADEPVQLRYDVVCAVDELGTPCSLAGRVYVRALGAASFEEVALVGDGESAFAASPPAAASRAGFEYYAVVETASGESLTVPPGGAQSPQRATVVPRWVDVDLGRHEFGRARPPQRLVASARWGHGRGDLGLDSGPEQARIGPSAFDVRADGAVVVLDQVNERLGLYEPGAEAPRSVPIEFAGGEGDLAVDGDGTVVILDDGGAARPPVVRRYARHGTLLATTPLGASFGDMLRIGRGGPIVHAYPAEKWLPAADGRRPLSPGEQRAGARTERAFPDGRGVLVRATDSEARFALVDGDRVLRSWRVTSGTPLGEVQLVEPFGGGLLVVLRVWTDTAAEFRVLELTPAGLARSFNVERAEWAESAPLSRFRLAGGSLYQLRSTSDGAQVVAFDLGGTR